MLIERIVMVAPAAPGSKGDEGMLRGALSLLEGFLIRMANPETGPDWISVLGDAGREPGGLAETCMPICADLSEARGEACCSWLARVLRTASMDINCDVPD
jgi:hypothetical protein